VGEAVAVGNISTRGDASAGGVLVSVAPHPAVEISTPLSISASNRIGVKRQNIFEQAP
jgi:hypothetical protein